MTLHSLPLFVRLAGRPVILLGAGAAAAAKRRLLDRAGALIVGEEADAAMAIVAIEDDALAAAAVARLKARGVLINAVDRPALCDFTLPAIVDRHPVLVAIGTGGVSAGLAAALRQRLEALLPAGLGALAEALHTARDALRVRLPDAVDRRRALSAALAAGGPLDPLGADNARLDMPFAGEGGNPGPLVDRIVAPGSRLYGSTMEVVALASPDPDDLTFRQARMLANADRVFHTADVPPAILDRARADAPRIVSPTPPVDAGPGAIVYVEMA